jgi:hypothetical protein
LPRHIAQRGVNRTHHALDLVQNFVVPETKHAVAARRQIGGSLGVGSDLAVFAVLAAVDFDHQSQPVACEIGEIPPDRRLTTEMRVVERQASQMPPELSLRIGHAAAKRSCSRDAPVRLVWFLWHRRAPHP